MGLNLIYIGLTWGPTVYPMGLFYSLDKRPLGFYKNIFEAPVPKVWEITCQFFHAPEYTKSLPKRGRPLGSKNKTKAK